MSNSRCMSPFHTSGPTLSLLLHLIRAPTPLPPTLLPPSTAAPCSSPSPTSILPFLRRRPHERKVHANGLVEEFRAVGAYDGGFGFFLGGVFDKDVALRFRPQISHDCDNSGAGEG